MNQTRIPLCVVTSSTYTVFICLTLQIFFFPVYSTAATFFRNDYDFYQNQRAFYKVHTMPKCWNQARIQCEFEASTLAVPNTAAEAEIFRDLIKKKMNTNSFAYIGILAVSKGIYNTFDAYTRIHEMEKCYKIHLQPKNWAEAYATCTAEQSYLAILNSKAESVSLVNLFNTTPHRYVTGNYLSGAIHLGYYDRFGEGVFQTLQGQTLTSAGFDKWAYMQPDHPGSEKCGSMFYNGELNDIGCDYRCFFICEHEAGDGSSALSIRNANAY